MEQIYVIPQKEIYQILEKLEGLQTSLQKKEEQQLHGRWLDNEQLMALLKVSKRTLQNWRDCGLITFSQVGHKIYYQYSEVEAMLQSRKNPSFR
ncbi:helix-turn-helix domain-containing protein [Pontibacter fetidus]|uniref:Helix-turn-helix domain-containing protein n=1 Tax=Pontibacter fetidus TaxID=2700082 RepID=A0A6B2H3K4_9BACT|nr:helix-turn-helix domain-containing protein [Pontibacter fetidus]NDK57695.1 helix-turn-helix domain-containing protein [Pontibacter fetidus]